MEVLGKAPVVAVLQHATVSNPHSALLKLNVKCQVYLNKAGRGREGEGRREWTMCTHANPFITRHCTLLKSHSCWCPFSGAVTGAPAHKGLATNAGGNSNKRRGASDCPCRVCRRGLWGCYQRHVLTELPTFSSFCCSVL